MSAVGKPRQIKINFPEEDLDRLQRKLDDARLPKRPILDDIQGWEYGTELSKLQQVLNDWKAGNPKDHKNQPSGKPNQGVKAWWRGVEDELNQAPHYLVEIEGITVHYQHFKPEGTSSMPPIPLIFSHGWPGSFTEGFHFASKLVQSRAPRFEVVVPSLPGYGLSEQPPRKGWTLQDTARVFDTLMTSVLGYKSYMAQGGDWGSVVTRFLANHEACKIFHINFLPPRPPYWAFPAMMLEHAGYKGVCAKSLQSLGYHPQEVLGVKRSFEYLTQGNGYVYIQSTQPSTLGYGMMDDPVSILCWILEKFQAWSDPKCPAFNRTDSNPTSLVSDETILTNIMVYYLTRSTHTSFLPYKESLQFLTKPDLRLWIPSRQKPFGYSSFPYELTAGPKSWVSNYKLNFVWFKRHEFGGHFAALDNPDALVQDMQEFANSHWPGF